MIPMGLAQVSAYAQEAPPPPPDQQYDQGPPPPDENAAPPQQWNELSPDQLNQLVAPIALYPDSLVAQILGASTYPTQVVEADRFVQSQAGAPPDEIAGMANNMNWDPSVKALCAFPSVLANMDKNLDWTTQLGNAYYNQPQDVMSSVQAMRQQAYSRGDLRSSQQLNVEYEPNQIIIEPANPAVVYVPYYDPWVMYGFHPWYRWYAPSPPPGWVIGAHFGFGVGVAVGSWGGWGWGWGHWGFAWGPHPYVAYNHVTYISRSVTVVNHGYYGHFDRGPEARSYNYHAAVQARGVDYRHVTEINNRTVINNNRTNYNNNNFNRGNDNRPAPGNFNRPGNNNGNYNRPNSDLARPPQNGRFNQPGNNNNGNYNRPNNNNNFNRPNNDTNRPGNFNRPNSELARPPQNNGNFNRPNNNNNSHPGNESRPAPRNEVGRPQGGGGERPHGDDKGDKGGHPHGR